MTAPSPASSLVPSPLPRGAADPVSMARALIRCASVTPADGGAQDVIAAHLEALGFTVLRARLGEGEPDGPVDNLYARWGQGPVRLCFAGHTDVVPPGSGEAWTHPPFSGDVTEETPGDGILWGRGAVDMKGGIAAALAALAGYMESERPDPATVALAVLITGDEEGPATFGTGAMLDWLEQRGERFDACILGEPTARQSPGDQIKVGRRGSLNATVTVRGTQGHTAYPHLADNPLPRLSAIAQALAGLRLDEGTDAFEPSTVALTSLDVGNAAPNVIPAAGTLRFNARFAPTYTGATLSESLRQTVDEAHRQAGGRPGELDISLRVTAEPFLTDASLGGAGPLVTHLEEAIVEVTGATPTRSTGGGTSDARFIRRHAPVVECGLPGETMHQIDERVAIADLRRLHDIYAGMLRRFFR